jgi:hypothetical protein
VADAQHGGHCIGELEDHGAQPRTVLLVEDGGGWQVAELNAG